MHLQIEDHLSVRDRRPPNYEDYFSCLLQIVQDETAEITNPLIRENVARLRDASAHLHVGYDAHIDNNSFASLAETRVRPNPICCLSLLASPPFPGGVRSDFASRQDV